MRPIPPFTRIEPGTSNAGFTLVELVMVIVILGLLSAVVLPRFTNPEGFRTSAFRDEVVAALRYAQKTATSHRRLVCATLTQNTVTLEIASVHGASACDTPLPGMNGEAAFASAGNNLITSGLGTMHFHPAGTAGPAAGGISNISIGIQGYAPVSVAGETGHVQ